MKNLFGKLSLLQAKGFALGVVHSEIENDLGDISFLRKRKEFLQNQILDLEKEIIQFVNTLDSEEVC